jgi:hypothetical protein
MAYELANNPINSPNDYWFRVAMRALNKQREQSTEALNTVLSGDWTEEDRANAQKRWDIEQETIIAIRNKLEEAYKGA